MSSIKTMAAICFFMLSLGFSADHEIELAPWKSIEKINSKFREHLSKNDFSSATFKPKEFRTGFNNWKDKSSDDQNSKPNGGSHIAGISKTSRNSISFQKIANVYKRDLDESSEILEDTENQKEKETDSINFDGKILDQGEESLGGQNVQNEEVNIDGFSAEEMTTYRIMENNKDESLGGQNEEATIDGFFAEEMTTYRIMKNTKDEIMKDANVFIDNSFLDKRNVFDTLEIEDVSVSHGTWCDRKENGTCWIEHAVGETLTLAVNISNSKAENPLQVQWTRKYHRRMKNDIEVKIEPDKVPWNMVIGNGDRELRLNPVTNTDLDPNANVAQVFLVTRIKDQPLRKQLIGRLEFRIVIHAIELNRIYFGEEVQINIENFITLPEKGDLNLEWRLEQSNGGPDLPLPSNFKVSRSGRLIIVKEIRKEHMGILSCTVFSSNNIAVAKRRFLMNSNGNNEPKILERTGSSLHKRHVRHGRCQQYAEAEELMDYNRKLSRKKRYRTKRGCKHHHFHRRLQPRWIPFLFGEEETTLDPRLMSIGELIELSNNSDGTLDDVIPHEVHYVEVMATVISDDFDVPSAQANCSRDSDCGTGASCVRPKGQSQTQEIQKGYCYCKPEYFGNGFECTKIPRIHRDKRIKRSITLDEDLMIQPRAFHIPKNKVSLIVENTNNKISIEEEKSTRELAFEQEDAFLLGTCSSNRDCSPHATCQPIRKSHPFCKCNPGYRGNGIFCWEIMDYLPS